MKKIKLLIPVMALLLFSCDDYLDVNDDPNRLRVDQVSASKLLPAAQTVTFRRQAINMNQLGNVYMNSWASNVASFTGGYANEFALNVDNAFYRAIFENLFLDVNIFQDIIELPNADGKLDNYVIASKVCKVHYMQYLVDLYGDIPYTDAFKGLANSTPKYNDDQFVYRQLFAELDEARALILAANPSAEDISAFDVMLHGDMTKWNELANTIELRMLLRMSNSTGAVAAYRDARLAALSGATFVTYDVTVNPGYNSGVDAQMNPFFGNFGIDSTVTPTQNWTFVAMSGHAYKFMRSYAPSNGTLVDPAFSTVYPAVNDPRAARIFRGTLRGVTQGSNTVDVPGAGTPARIGYGCWNPNLQTLGAGFNDPVASNDDIMAMAANDGYFMTASEAFFLQSEAAVRYPGLFSGDQANFDAGILASFDFRGLTVLAPTAYATYNAAIASKAGLGWPASTTDDLKYRAIMTQKWIALMGIHGIESFIDYNRTGYPVTPLASGSTPATQPRKPRRLIYPVSEYISNAANVPNITPSNIFAVTDTSHPFWMLGDPALGN